MEKLKDEPDEKCIQLLEKELSENASIGSYKVKFSAFEQFINCKDLSSGTGSYIRYFIYVRVIKIMILFSIVYGMLTFYIALSKVGIGTLKVGIWNIAENRFLGGLGKWLKKLTMSIFMRNLYTGYLP